MQIAQNISRAQEWFKGHFNADVGFENFKIHKQTRQVRTNNLTLKHMFMRVYEGQQLPSRKIIMSK